MAQTLTNTTTTTDWLLDRLLTSSSIPELDHSVTSMDPTDEIALAVAGDSWDALASLPPSPVVPGNVCVNTMAPNFWDDPLLDLIALKSSSFTAPANININFNPSIIAKAPPNTPRPPVNSSKATHTTSNTTIITTTVNPEDKLVINPNINLISPPPHHPRPNGTNTRPINNINIHPGKQAHYNIIRPRAITATPPPTPTKYHPATAAAMYTVNPMGGVKPLRKVEPVQLRPKVTQNTFVIQPSNTTAMTMSMSMRSQPGSSICISRIPTPSQAFHKGPTTITTNGKKRMAPSNINSEADTRGARRPKRYKSATPSRFCHVCGRKAATTRVALCGRLIDGLCRKVVCERCIIKYNWEKDAPVGKNTPDKNWSCPHCRGVCVPKASCSTYERINSKRKLVPRSLTNDTNNTDNNNNTNHHSIINSHNNNNLNASLVTSSESTASITSSTTTAPQATTITK